MNLFCASRAIRLLARRPLGIGPAVRHFQPPRPTGRPATCLAWHSPSSAAMPTKLGQSRKLAAANIERVHEDPDLDRIVDFLVQEHALLLDVRTPEEFASGSVPGAVNIPVSDLPQRVGELPKDTNIAVFCAAGVRSKSAKSFLQANGHPDVEDGIDVRYMTAALEILEGKSRIMGGS